MTGEVAPVYVLQGVNGQVEVYANKVRIRRKGVMSKLTQGFFAGEKDIYFHLIGSVLVKRAGLMTNGYIAFAPLGNVERRRGLVDSTHDENTVMFNRSQADVVEQIRTYIEARMGAQAAPVSPPPDVGDQLKKLAELRDAGILTPEEYEVKRRDLVARL